ncbi:MAG: shikimate dehydrogenase [Nitrospirota bacterium]
MISGKTALYGIFGYPITHTFSPAMHNAAFKKLNMDACYVPFSVKPEDLEKAAEAILPLGIKGLNVTVPHKEKVIPFLDQLSEEARLIGAVNTIEIRDDKLIGHNTDGTGFLRSLTEQAGFQPEGKLILLIGAGGAARAVGFSLALSNAKKICLYDVASEKASVLAAELQTKTGVEAVALEEDDTREAALSADCLINATPIGLHKSDPLPFSENVIQKRHLVCDLVYNPPVTPLLRAAKMRGAYILSGWGMLLYQGIAAFELWAGRSAPLPVMKSALLRQIRAQS